MKREGGYTFAMHVMRALVTMKNKTYECGRQKRIEQHPLVLVTASPSRR